MPEGTGTPVAAAPAPAAPSAPSTPSTPATPSASPTPAAPSSVEQTPPAAPPAAAAPVVTDAGTETPIADAPKVPVRSDFSDDAKGIEDFLKARNAYEEANGEIPELVTGDEVTVEKTPEEIAAEEKAKADAEAGKSEEEKAADAAKLEEAKGPETPEALSKLMDATPELKALMEADPKVKGALFAMARQNAQAAPVLKLIPNEAAAKFALETSNEFVGLKTSFTLSDTPEKMRDAASQFIEQFAIVDDKGQPVLDSAGHPTYGEDLGLFTSEIKARDNGARMDGLRERIAAGKYATEEGRDNDEQLLAAYEFIAAAEAADPDELDKPDTSGMTPEAKAYFDKKDAELKAEKERLGLKDKDMNAKQKSAARESFDLKYRETFGANTGRFLGNYLKQKAEAGIAIPQYLLTMTDPKTGVSVFAQQAFQRLNQKLSKTPDVRAHSATLQMNAINDQGLAARLEYSQARIDEYLPGIIDSILEEAGVSLVKESQDKIEARTTKQAGARVEPSGGGPIIPKGASEKQVYEQAKKNVLAKNPNVDGSELMRLALIERDRLETQR